MRKRMIEDEEEEEVRLPGEWLFNLPSLNYDLPFAKKRYAPSQHVIKTLPSLSHTAV